MLRSMQVFAAALILTLQAALVGQQSSKLESFSFEGVPLLSSVRDLRLRQPSAQHVASESEVANGLQCYALAKTSSRGIALLYFLDEKLFTVQVLYEYESITKMGGAEKLAEKMITAFGQVDDVQKNDKAYKLSWDKPGRHAEFILGSTTAALWVKDTKLEALLNERRAKGTNLGF